MHWYWEEAVCCLFRSNFIQSSSNLSLSLSLAFYPLYRVRFAPTSLLSTFRWSTCAIYSQFCKEREENDNRIERGTIDDDRMVNFCVLFSVFCCFCEEFSLPVTKKQRRGQESYCCRELLGIAALFSIFASDPWINEDYCVRFCRVKFNAFYCASKGQYQQKRLPARRSVKCTTQYTRITGTWWKKSLIIISLFSMRLTTLGRNGDLLDLEFQKMILVQSILTYLISGLNNRKFRFGACFRHIYKTSTTFHFFGVSQVLDCDCCMCALLPVICAAADGNCLPPPLIC